MARRVWSDIVGSWAEEAYPIRRRSRHTHLVRNVKLVRIGSEGPSQLRFVTWQVALRERRMPVKRKGGWFAVSMLAEDRAGDES